MKQPTDTAEIAELAASHGLAVEPESMKLIDLGLDFRVAIARTDADEKWVLRIPRRPDVTSRADIEGRLLALIAPELDVAVPEWRIHAANLIAYPLLPGEPGLSLEYDGTPLWHYDKDSLAFAESLGELLAQLHAIDPQQVAESGVDVRTPAATRQALRDDIARVSAKFEISSDLLDRWTAWLADDSYWPDRSTLTHGEIYPAHLLLDGEQIVSVLDWTTAAVSDPAKDFMFQHASVTPETFDATVARYVECGGTAWPRLAEHCAEWFSTSSLNYGIFALQTGDPEHAQAAAAQLNPGTA